MSDTPRTFFDVVLHQRACRDFADTPVDDRTLASILEAATHAPSAENSQPWEFIVVRDPTLRAGLADITYRMWVEVARDFEKNRLDRRLFEDTEHGATGGIATAPVMVVVAADTTRCLDTALHESVWPAVQNLLLAANALALGSSLMTLPLLADEDIVGLLALPDHVRPMAVVPLGYPARPLGPARRRAVDAVTHRDRFGTRW